MNLGALSVKINADISNLSKGLAQASAQTKAFANRMNGTTATVKDLNKATMEYGFNMSSVKRIVSGIVIAQVFYKALGAIQDSTSAVIEFSNSLEYAHVAFANLFRDTDLAEEFINVLKDFAATTPFNFSESEQAAKRLLAYGIQYKNVMYVMQGVMSAAAMQNDPAKVESISRALGQIYTKGRLMNQEMNQLTEAGIPAWEILQEKMGLTADQIGEIGNLKIPANDAINALVDGMTERFGDVVTASSRTLSGIISNIQDNALMIGANLIAPVMGQVKYVADALGQWLYNIREIMDLKGFGGVFENIIPPEAQMAVKTFLANVMSLWTVIKYYLASAFNVAREVLYSLMVAFNAVAPAIILVADVLGRLIYYVSTNSTAVRILASILIGAAAAFVVFKAKAIGALVINAVTSAVMTLAKALLLLSTILRTHPILGLLGLIAGGVTAVAVASSGAGSAIDNFLGKLSSINGIDTDSLLLPESEERASDLEKFNNKLDSTTDSLGDADDATKKLNDSAKKLKKGLLSFDEVFRLNDNDKGTNGGGGGAGDLDYNVGDLGIGDLGGDSWIPDVGDLSGFGTDFVDGLIESLKNAFGLKGDALSAVMSAGIGAAMGAVIGGLLGGPIGAAIGALAGGIVGLLWNKLSEAFNLSNTQTVAIPIGTFIGAAIGSVLGGPAGAVIGGAIGAFVSNLFAMLVDGFKDGNWRYEGIGASLGTLIGAAIGFAISGPPGAIIGAAAGSLAGSVIGLIVKAFTTGDIEYKSIGAGLGTLIGAAIGFAIGGPPGAAIGVGIGTLVGWLVGALAESVANADWGVAVGTMGMLIGGAIGGFVGGPVGFLIGTAVGGLVAWIGKKLVEFIAGIDWVSVGKAFAKPLTDLFKDTTGMFGEAIGYIKEAFKSDNFLDFGKNIALGLFEGFLATIYLIPGTVASFFVGLISAICEVFGINSPAEKMKIYGKYILLGILEGIINALISIPGYISKTGKAIINAFKDWFGEAGLSGKIKGWMDDGVTHIKTFVSNTKTSISEWYTNTKNKFDNWKTNVTEKISTWYTTNVGKFSDWKTNTVKNIKDWATDTQKNINTWYTNTVKSISDWWTNVKKKFDAFKDTSFSTWTTNTLRTIKNWANDVWDSIKDKFGKAIDKVKEFLKIKDTNTSTSSSSSSSSNGRRQTNQNSAGHATGGVFNREHIARFAEGNKAEAIIPLETQSAMQPFVDAVSTGVIQTLAPMMASTGTSNTETQPIMYVGTLIADDRSLRELERKMKVIRLEEARR